MGTKLETALIGSGGLMGVAETKVRMVRKKLEEEDFWVEYHFSEPMVRLMVRKTGASEPIECEKLTEKRTGK